MGKGIWGISIQKLGTIREIRNEILSQIKLQYLKKPNIPKLNMTEIIK